MRINQHELARQIALREGGRINLSIAQVKEVLSIALSLLGEYPDAAVRDAIRRAARRRAARGGP